MSALHLDEGFVHDEQAFVVIYIPTWLYRIILIILLDVVFMLINYTNYFKIQEDIWALLEFNDSYTYIIFITNTIYKNNISIFY